VINRILVTGGAGFIGSTTVDLLLARGYQVRVMDSLQERVHPRGWPSYLPAAVERFQGDVRNRAHWAQALEGVQGVFHLAAYQDYMPDFSTFFHVNAVSTALLFELIVEQKLPVEKVVLASSQAVYGEGKYRCGKDGIVYPPSRPAAQLARGEWEVRCPACAGPLEHLPITEDRVNPHTAYGISKYTLELAALNLGRKYGIPSVCLRYSIVQGPRNSFYNAYSGICRIFTLRLLHDQPPVCYEDGNSLRDYVYVGDVARANVLVLEDERADFRAFNVAGPGATSVRQYARLAARACGKDIEPLINGEYRFGDTRHTVSSGEALGALGWRPEVPLEQVVAEYVEWVRAQPDLADFYARSASRMREADILRRSRA
jgi:dTDP-L-rhamnose 4-epimerase